MNSTPTMPKAINLNIKVHCRFDLLQASNTLSDRLRPCCCQRVSWSEKCHNVKRFYLLGFLWEDSTYKSQIFSLLYLFIQSSSVTQSCLTLCNPMDRSMPGLPITNSQSLLKLMSIESVMPSNHLILRRPLFLSQPFPASGSFQINQFFELGGQSIGVSASASLLPMNIQD